VPAPRASLNPRTRSHWYPITSSSTVLRAPKNFSPVLLLLELPDTVSRRLQASTPDVVVLPLSSLWSARTVLVLYHRWETICFFFCRTCRSRDMNYINIYTAVVLWRNLGILLLTTPPLQEEQCMEAENKLGGAFPVTVTQHQHRSVIASSSDVLSLTSLPAQQFRRCGKWKISHRPSGNASFPRHRVIRSTVHAFPRFLLEKDRCLFLIMFESTSTIPHVSRLLASSCACARVLSLVRNLVGNPVPTRR